MNYREELPQLFADFKEEKTLAVVKDLIACGEHPLAILSACQQGMQIVGERYESGQYYISALIMAGELFREVFSLVSPLLASNQQPELSPSRHQTMLICTVRGDIHDIGKSIATILFQVHGFRVIDLGVNVPPGKVAQAVIELRPDLVGLSGLLTSAFDSMKETVRHIRESTQNWEHRVPIILGGSPLTQAVCDYAGADLWCTDAMEGLQKAVALLRQNNAS